MLFGPLYEIGFIPRTKLSWQASIVKLFEKHEILPFKMEKYKELYQITPFYGSSQTIFQLPKIKSKIREVQLFCKLHSSQDPGLLCQVSNHDIQIEK